MITAETVFKSPREESFLGGGVGRGNGPASIFAALFLVAGFICSLQRTLLWRSSSLVMRRRSQKMEEHEEELEARITCGGSDQVHENGGGDEGLDWLPRMRSRHQQGGVVGTAATNHFGFDPLRFPVYDLEAVCFRSSTPIPALLDSPSPVSLSIPSRRPRIRVPKNGDRDLGALPPLSRLSV
ncbi:hypothetical protein B296_00018974 [Ensete ventricosum]|uniref:Uncharacterized protein n=1 Tax=Ensete ventricosum TaxID=4639 RepID=A0A427B395_ENSVE|nr:hypothetical protein B296_00018974 [Ensete ventricosum]